MPLNRLFEMAASNAVNGARPSRPRREPRRLSPLTLRILAVNVMALGILVGGLMYLGRYQERLIQTEMDALRTEARIFAGALGEGAVISTNEDETELSPDLARHMVRRLVETTETRTRLFDTNAGLIADSQLLLSPGGMVQIEELPESSPGNRITRLLVAIYDGLTQLFPSQNRWPVYIDPPPGHAGDFRDVRRALAGEVSATIWSTPGAERNGGLILTVAVPIQQFKHILGAVMLSRSGTEIDAAIRSVRLEISKVFLFALAVTVLMSFYLAGTIARPIRRLALAADRLRHGHGRHSDIPDFTARGDEIGDLSEALRDMTAALWARMDAIEQFAADVAHEIKNPLSSLRSAVETVARVPDPARQQRLMSIIVDDVQRLDRLISDISNASRLDAELSRAEATSIDVAAMLRMLVDIETDTAGPETPTLRLDLEPGAVLTVDGLEGRLVQVFQNILANATSFSPRGGTVTISAHRRRNIGPIRLPNHLPAQIEIRFEDEGPGIPDNKCEAIFDRFYSERPASEKFGTHSGLGLSISKQIVEAHGGTIRADNRHDATGRTIGAMFTVRLPAS
ncbi:MAG: stimulus-sensing domain-containing protein [Azospirillaceae bacterium]|nr:stimulus-sensing domain-containing protein [Azospirillaceae bacterium]